MGKSIHDDVLDAALGYLRDNGTRIHLCNAQPTTYTQANSTYALGAITVDSSDYTLANGDTNGRKVTVSAQSSIGIGTTGNCNHLAITNASDTLLLVTTVTSQDVTSGNAASTPAFDDEIADPT